MHYESTPLEKLDEYSEKFRNGEISAREYLLKFRYAARRVPYDPAISLAAKALKIQMDFSAAKPSRVSEADRKEAMELFEAAIRHDAAGLTTPAGLAGAGASLARNSKALAALDALSEKFAEGQLSPDEYIESFRETAARAPAGPKHLLSAKALQIQIDFTSAPAGTVTEAHREAAMELFAAALEHDRSPAGHDPRSEVREAAKAKAKTAPAVDKKREISHDR